MLSTVSAASSKEQLSIPEVKISRSIRSATDSSGLQLTLYQYQSCPFCCKVRAYLDYHGFSYDVIEVNSVTQAEIRWSKYRKVPILVCRDQDNRTLVQLNDSSLIVSLLSSYLLNRSESVTKLQSYYPAIETKNSRGKTVFEFPNKYFMMHGETGSVTDDRKEERHWRQWTDGVLVHALSPNIYRTPAESLQAFHHFSDAGDWQNTFGTPKRLFIIYVGAAAMYFVGRILKKRHNLKDDVRESLYDACREWSVAVHNAGGKFLGGDRPNLADLAVYGVLSSIDGCNAFEDVKQHTDIARWFFAVKKCVAANAGQPMASSDRLALPAV